MSIKNQHSNMSSANNLFFFYSFGFFNILLSVDCHLGICVGTLFSNHSAKIRHSNFWTFSFYLFYFVNPQRTSPLFSCTKMNGKRCYNDNPNTNGIFPRPSRRLLPGVSERSHRKLHSAAFSLSCFTYADRKFCSIFSKLRLSNDSFPVAVKTAIPCE